VSNAFDGLHAPGASLPGCRGGEWGVTDQKVLGEVGWLMARSRCLPDDYGFPQTARGVTTGAERAKKVVFVRL